MVLEIKIECGLWKVLEKSLKNGYNFFYESWFKYFFCSDTNKQGKKTTCIKTHTSRSLAPSYPAKLWSFCLKVVLPFSVPPSCKLICPMTKNPLTDVNMAYQTCLWVKLGFHSWLLEKGPMIWTNWAILIIIFKILKEYVQNCSLHVQ